MARPIRLALAGLLLSAIPTAADSGQAAIHQKEPGKRPGGAGNLAGAKNPPLPLVIVTTRTDAEELEAVLAIIIDSQKRAQPKPQPPACPD